MLSTQPKFNPGDRFMLALHGLCALHGSYTLQIRVSDADAYGIRPLMDSATLKRTLQAPLEEPPQPPARSNHRSREWTRLLRSGDMLTGRRVLLELAAIQRKQGRLSPDEQRLLERLQTSLCEEISEVLKVEWEEARRMLGDLMADPPSFLGQPIPGYG
ncbi:MAG: hypothetical protein ACYCW6_29645 [Candidatus Xenobia bacterium]